MATEPAAAVSTQTNLICKNCGTELDGRYCSRCGQADKTTDPSLHDLLHELTHEFLHLDGKIVATLKALVVRPGQLSAEFLAGRRACYIGPVRLYLTFSVLFFLVVAYSPRQAKIVPAKDVVALDLNVNGKDLAKVNVSPHDTPDAKRTRTEPESKSRIEEVATKAVNEPEVFRHAFVSNMSRVMFVIVPLFALGLRIAYRKRPRRYPSFVYFSLHYHAFVFLALALYFLAGMTRFSLVQWVVGWAVAICLPVYLFLALRRVFGGTARNTVLRMLALTAFYFPCFVMGLGVAGMITLYML